MRVPTAENRIEQSCEHMPSNGELVSALGTSPESPYLVEIRNRSSPKSKKALPHADPRRQEALQRRRTTPCGIAACC